MNKKDTSDNKIHVNNFDSNYSIVQDNHSNNNNNNNDSHTHFNDKNNSEDESNDELDNSQQLNGMELNKIVIQKNQTLLTVESSKSASISMKHTALTNTCIFLQGLFLQCLHKAIITILCLQLS